MIIRWVKNLADAARARDKAQNALDGAEMTGPEQKRVASELERCNRDIGRYAERINEDLRRAAAKRVKVSYPRALESIHDRQLRDYCQSVGRTIEKLNHQIAIDGAQAEDYLRELNNKKKQALKVQDVAVKNQQSLCRELDKLEKREKEVAGRIEGRKRDLQKIEAERKRAANDNAKFDTERGRVEAIHKQKKDQMLTLQDELESLRRRKAQEQDPARREPLKEKIAKIEPQLAQLEPYVKQHIEFQLGQYKQIDDRIKGERSQLGKARDQVEKDIAVLESELAEVRRLRKVFAQNIEQETKRKASVATTLKDMKRAEGWAKRAGVRV